MTLEELKEKLLALYDPDDLLELLEVTSEDLLDRFEDLLINRMDYLEKELESDGDQIEW